MARWVQQCLDKSQLVESRGLDYLHDGGGDDGGGYGSGGGDDDKCIESYFGAI